MGFGCGKKSLNVGRDRTCLPNVIGKYDRILRTFDGGQFLILRPR